MPWLMHKFLRRSEFIWRQMDFCQRDGQSAQHFEKYFFSITCLHLTANLLWSISFFLLDSCGFYFPALCLLTIRLSQCICVITGFPIIGCSQSWMLDVGSTCFFHGFNLSKFSIWRNTYYSHVFSTEGWIPLRCVGAWQRHKDLEDNLLWGRLSYKTNMIQSHVPKSSIIQ